MPAVAAPCGAPAGAGVLARAGGENFPVASRLLGRRLRADLLALYGFARLVDELGDAFAGDRLAALDWVEAELDRAYEGAARHPLLVRLQPTLRAHALPRGPFLRLIEANRTDQRVTRYQSWEQLRAYCTLSANPVGELVLHLFEAADAPRIALSDSVCTALQLIEHCQDVSEDYANGRVYVPAEDLARFGVGESELALERSSAAVRELLAFELARARELLDAGVPLVRELSGRGSLAVAAFIAGGRAAVEAVERGGYEVLGGAPRATRAMLARAMLATLTARAGEVRRAR